MIVLLSPAKNLNEQTTLSISKKTTPAFLSKSEKLIGILKGKSEQEISKLMKLSEKLTSLNVDRYKSWQKSHTTKNSQTAISTFNGAVYLGFDASSLTEKDLLYAQHSIRILSGLYGILKPLDKMQPYRLEMGTKLKVENAKNLYEFWGSDLTNQLNKELKKQDSILLNLASNEYFKAIQPKEIKGKIVSCKFLDKTKNGNYKALMAYAKKARGFMARFVVKNQISEVENLKAFQTDGYYYSPKESTEEELVFLRD